MEGEGGGLIRKIEINLAEIIKELPNDSKEKFPWLWSIDPYGLTMFNLYQVPHVINELEELARLNKSLESEIKDIIEFMKQIEQHTYIRLIGD